MANVSIYTNYGATQSELGRILPGAVQGDYERYTSHLNSLSDRFSSLFTNSVGRAPTAGEMETFLQQYVVPHTKELTTSGSNYNTYQDQFLNDFVGSTYKKAAQDETTRQLEAQQGKANDLANLFRTQGTTALGQYGQSLESAVSDTEQQLIDFQSRLFDKLRPNLITSLQAQGLLDTGGLNQAVAGAQKDLGLAAQDTLMNARLSNKSRLAELQLQNEMDANAISQGAAMDPYQFRREQALGSVPNFLQQGQQAMGNTLGAINSSQDYARQVGLMKLHGQIQSDARPSFLRTLGQNFAGSFGNAAGQFAGNPNNWASMYMKASGIPA